jgi:hypothetical protein
MHATLDKLCVNLGRRRREEAQPKLAYIIWTDFAVIAVEEFKNLNQPCNRTEKQF